MGSDRRIVEKSNTLVVSDCQAVEGVGGGHP